MRGCVESRDGSGRPFDALLGLVDDSFTHACRIRMYIGREKTFGFGARRMFMQPRIDSTDVYSWSAIQLSISTRISRSRSGLERRTAATTCTAEAPHITAVIASAAV